MENLPLITLCWFTVSGLCGARHVPATKRGVNRQSCTREKLAENGCKRRFNPKALLTLACPPVGDAVTWLAGAESVS